MVTTVCSQRSALLSAQKYASCGAGPLTAVLSIPCAVTKMTRIAIILESDVKYLCRVVAAAK